MTTDIAIRPDEAEADLHMQMELAKTLAVSSLLPRDLKGKPADVLVTVLYGRELGLSPMQSIQGIYVVNGRPTMSGQLWLAKVRQAGHKVVIKATDKAATCTITRSDDPENPHTEEFTWEQAEKARLTSKDTWKSWPKRMLTWRAVSNCATIACPEVALGFEVTELVRDEQQLERPTLAQVAAQREDKTPVDAELVDPDEDEIRAAVAEMHQQAVGSDADQEDGWPAVATIPGTDQ